MAITRVTSGLWGGRFAGSFIGKSSSRPMPAEHEVISGLWGGKKHGSFLNKTFSIVAVSQLDTIGGKPEKKKKKKKYGEEYTWEWLASLEPRVKEVVEQVAKEGLEEKTITELNVEKKAKSANELFARLENLGLEARYFNDILQLRLRYIDEQIKIITARIEQQKQEEIDVLTILMMEL